MTVTPVAPAPTPAKVHPRIHSSGSLDSYTPTILTPVIGNEFPKGSINIVDDILHAPNAEERIRDLAVMIAERGVVFFRAQDNLTDDLQKTLVRRLGELTTRPVGHDLYIHPLLNSVLEYGESDPQLSAISSLQRKRLYEEGINMGTLAAIWHTDTPFERAPGDFSALRITLLPETGGDTLWASGYELYDRLSKPYRQFVETLTVSYEADGFRDVARKSGVNLYTDARGSPLNVGTELTAEHPVVRTNPITGWKSIFPVGSWTKKINGLRVRESENLLKYFQDTVTLGHDLQVRFKWHDPNDIALWDNRSTFHSATFDFDGLGERRGKRAIGIGEVPYFDPTSRSRREDLGLEDTLPVVHL
ncbi:tfdA family taurine dioxygenase [Aspergillus coremiiformis]|uniref:TfdA family taurine dioxygenase n=1 Tax=Aspergillus coremiiformis TaxID=138285 RepID=A0A5N6Z3I7_9EURO|nr:tfdA family taurine dioxygenase [Aspergillus coremiiformis]